MIVYIVRHAIAHERDAARWPDDADRPLTDKGIARFQKVAARLLELGIGVDACFTSPLVRAVQTAEILCQHGDWPEAEVLTSLAPEGEPLDVIAALSNAPGEVVAIVGHEPSLSDLLACMLSGDGAEPLGSMKKGGVAYVEFAGQVSAGEGVLRWLATPKLLIGES